LLLVLFMLDL